MIGLLWSILAILISPCRSNARLEAENAVLRHQLLVLRRKCRGRVRLTNFDRWIFVQLCRLFPSALQVLHVIRPETLVRWHRAGFRSYWRWKSRNRGGRRFSGGTMQRPALQRLLADIAASRIDVVVVYKVDRLTRALGDFARIVELLDRHNVSFVSVTQAINTTTSMGRLTLNVLLSFAQFEREVTGERIRDKIAASKKKGMWMGGYVPLGYGKEDRSLVIVENEAEVIRTLFRLYLELGTVAALKAEADRLGLVSKLYEG